MNRKLLLAACCMLFGSLLVRGQVFFGFQLNQYGGSFPNGFTVYNSNLYFQANDSTHGYEPWVSNGTSAQLLADINPGSGNSFPQFFIVYKNKLYFQADDGSHGAELWVTEGPDSGAQMVKDINPGPEGAMPQNFYVFNNLLYFAADDGTNGMELWSTDGTAANTQMVKNINPVVTIANSDTNASSFPSGFDTFNDSLFFQADDGTHGFELWMTDASGTTEMVDAINPDSIGSFPSDLTAFNGKLYFAANDGTHGNELWVTDGTDSGTQLVKDIFPGYQSSNPQGLTVFGGKLIFQATDSINGTELWMSDGTENGTQLLMDINPGTPGSYPNGFTAYNNKLYFQAIDSAHGAELWATNGTSAQLVDDIVPGPLGSDPAYFTIYDNSLYFIANPDSDMGLELFVTNGDSIGTFPLIPGDSSNTNPLNVTQGLTVYNDLLAFNADYDATGEQLWFFSYGTSAVQVVSSNKNYAVYPNPFSQNFTIANLQPGESYNIRLSDITGRTLLTQQILAADDHMQFSAAELSSGIYVLQVQNSLEEGTMRIVKAK